MNPEKSISSPVPKKRRLSPALSSAEIIGGHQDLLTEILLLLPAKSLLRFKSVSKHWNSLISSEDFSHRHLRRRRPDTHHSFILGAQGRSQFFIFDPTAKKLTRFRLPCTFPFVDEHVKILQSCHGLLLLECAYAQRGRRYYFVLNPVTQKFNCIRIGDAAVAMTLIFDPSKSRYYNVMGIWRHHMALYWSQFHKWSTDSPSPREGLKSMEAQSCNNVAYFVRNKHPIFYYSSEGMGFAPCPPVKGHIVESNGHLHCVSLFLNRDRPCFCVSEMIDYNWLEGEKTDWRQMERLLDEQRRSIRSQVEFLGMIRGETVEDSVFLVHVPGQIIIYRIRDEVFEVAVDYREDYFYQEGRLQFGFKDAHPFVGSFASV